LTRDPELKKVGTQDTSVVNFTVAISRYYKNKTTGENVKETEFVPCVAWDSGADLIHQLFHKGDPILVEGTLREEKWEKEGEKRSRFIVRVSNFETLKPKSVETGTTTTPVDQTTTPATPEVPTNTEAAIPF